MCIKNKILQKNNTFNLNNWIKFDILVHNNKFYFCDSTMECWLESIKITPRLKYVINLLLLSIGLCIVVSTDSRADPPNRTEDDSFKNPYISEETRKPNLLDKVWWKFKYYMIQKPLVNDNFEYTVIPPEYVNPPDRFQSGAVTWVGHATFLIQIDNVNILTDPVWSERVGILNSKIGMQRYTPPGIPWEKLPPIDVVLISHNHYDHLDYLTVMQLEEEHQPLFFVPLGIGDLLEEWGVTHYSEKDWWEGEMVNEVNFVAVPAQHQSRRAIHDHNATLWSGWVVEASRLTLYFAGDTGYFPGFKDIGEQFGPIDLAMMPIGAYDPEWYNSLYHVNPAEALQAFIDLDARYFAAMHWGTFDQSEERLSDPPRDLMRYASSLNVDLDKLWIFAFGEQRAIPPREPLETITLQEDHAGE